MQFFDHSKEALELPDDRNSEEYLKDLQRRVDIRRLGLCVKPRLATPQQFDEEAFAIFLHKFKDKKYADIAESLVRQHLRYISMEELQKNLLICVNLLNAKLEGNEYGIIASEYHSQQWMAELSLRHLNKLPFTRAWMNGNFKYPRHDLNRAKTWVMIDDGAYSGKQLATQVLWSLFDELAESSDELVEGSSEKCSYQVFIVIPFMTKHAHDKVVKKVKTLQEEFQERVDIKVEIICSEFILSIIELPLDDKIKPDILQVLDASSFENLKGNVLIRTDWKRLDCYSMPRTFTEACVPYLLDRYDGMHFNDIPKFAKEQKPFIPETVTPYGHYGGLASDSADRPGFF